MNRLFDVASLIVTVALATTLVSHPETANVITSIGKAFSSSINAAKS